VATGVETLSDAELQSGRRQERVRRVLPQLIRRLPERTPARPALPAAVKNSYGYDGPNDGYDSSKSGYQGGGSCNDPSKGRYDGPEKGYDGPDGTY
jgi:hypothetical protein